MTAEEDNEDPAEVLGMELEPVDPNEMEIDEEANERRGGVGPHTEGGNLEDSIRETRVFQPVIAREGNDGVLRVVAGQRRTLAAQAVDEEYIPVLIMDLDGGDARLVSILENDEELKKDVSRKDRAKSTAALVEEEGSQRAAATRLGVDDSVISRRVERTRNFWSGTVFDADEKDTDFSTEDLNDQLLMSIRSVCDDSEEAEKVGKKIINEQIPNRIVSEAVSESESAPELRDNIDHIREESGIDNQVQTFAQFSGDEAEALEEWAKERGANQKEAVETLVAEKLRSEGLL